MNHFKDDKYSPYYIPPGYDPKKDAVKLVVYNPHWVVMAECEMKVLHKAFSSC